MTGILPIKKYGTHSALNMFNEYSMTEPKALAEYIGFTEDEVVTLCDKYKMDFDEINYIDILDCNGGDHGYPFATNFNPEINIREVSAKGSYWENGNWVETEPMEIKREF